MSRSFAFLLGLQLCAVGASAQVPYRVVDLESAPADSRPVELFAHAGDVYFRAAGNGVGEELFKSDGTTAGTALVKDLERGYFRSYPGGFTEMAGELYFLTSDGDGSGLWKTDGSEAGTTRVCATGCGTIPTPFAVVSAGGTLFYAGRELSTGVELWASDGSEAGTRLLMDIRPGALSGAPSDFTTLADVLYFVADDGVSGRELWRSDGTVGGTTRVADINPGGPSDPAGMVVLGDALFFVADDGSTGHELWTSDGTAAGTNRVADVCLGLCDGLETRNPNLIAHAGAVLFQGDDGMTGAELWSSDGTTPGTRLVADLKPGTGDGRPRSMVEAGDWVYFEATAPSIGSELFRTDGTTAGTAPIGDLNPAGNLSPRHLTAFGDRVVFQGFSNVERYEPWISDGTAAGSFPLGDLSSADSFPEQFTVLGSEVLFQAGGDVVGDELWKTDGTAAGTVLVADIAPGTAHSRPQAYTDLGGEAYFWANVNDDLDWSYFRSDGTDSGTRSVLDSRRYGSWFYGPPRVFDGSIFLPAEADGSGLELWRTDGTAPGTRRVSDVLFGDGDAWPFGLSGLPGQLLFGARGPLGIELYRTDGTLPSTEIVADLRPGTESSELGSLVAASDRVFLVADPDGSGRSLFSSDGPSVVRLTASGDPEELTLVGDVVYFSDWSLAGGRSLWRSDGTAGGTFEVADRCPSCSFAPRDLTAAQGGLYFTADDGVAGRELWLSDGTDPGTRLVADVCAGCGQGVEIEAVAVGAGLYFSADDGVAGSELWHTDGTTTTRVADIWPGAEGSSIDWMVAHLGRLYFVADDGASGRELWSSDGTGAGTAMVADIHPGERPSYPLFLSPIGDRLFFTADDGVTGLEPWVLDPNAAPPDLLRCELVTDIDPLTPPRASVLPVDPARDRYVPGFVSGQLDPDGDVIDDGDLPLLFYEVEGAGQILLSEQAGRLRIDF